MKRAAEKQLVKDHEDEGDEGSQVRVSIHGIKEHDHELDVLGSLVRLQKGG